MAARASPSVGTLDTTPQSSTSLHSVRDSLHAAAMEGKGEVAAEAMEGGDGGEVVHRAWPPACNGERTPLEKEDDGMAGANRFARRTRFLLVTDVSPPLQPRRSLLA